MNIEPNSPEAPFDFVEAVAGMFHTSGGRAFAWRLLFWTTAGISVVMLVTLPFILPHYGPLIEFNALNMQATMSGGTPPDPGPILGSMVKLIPGFIAMMLGFWLVYAAGEAALHRKILRDEEAAKRPLRFGADELRVMVAQLGAWAMFFVIYIGGVFIIAFALAIPGLGVVLAVLGGFAMMALLVVVPIRIAPAAALSVFNKQQHLMAARHVTKGRFWWLFLAYFTVFIGGYFLVYFAMYICLLMVTGDPNFILNIYGMGDVEAGEAFANASQRFKNPLVMFMGVLAVILYSLVYALWMLSMSGIGAYAVKWWHGDDPVSKFE